MRTVKKRNNHLVIDERLNAIDYLEKTEYFVRNIDSDVYAYKWIFISVHGALYGFAVSACRGTNNSRVVKKDGKLISIRKALQYCQDPNIMRMFTFSNPLVLTDMQRESIEWLVSEFRNNFQHFKPKGWSISLSGIPNLIIEVLDVIRFLAIDTRNINLNKNQKRIIKSHIFQSKKILKKSEYYVEDLNLENINKT